MRNYVNILHSTLRRKFSYNNRMRSYGKISEPNDSDKTFAEKLSLRLFFVYFWSRVECLLSRGQNDCFDFL